MRFDVPPEVTTENQIENNEKREILKSTLDISEIPEDVTSTDYERVADAVIAIAREWGEKSGVPLEDLVFCAFEGDHEYLVRKGAQPENDNDGSIYASTIDDLHETRGDSAVLTALDCAGDEPCMAVYDSSRMQSDQSNVYIPLKGDYKGALIGLIKIVL